MTVELTKQDFDVLMEAVDAWESKDAAGEIVGAIFTAMACRDDPAAQQKMKADMATEKRDNEAKKRVAKERAVLLKAKLIALRDSVIVDELVKNY